MQLIRPFRFAAAAAAGIALLGGGLVQQQSAHAFAEWCFDDPLVLINGNLVDTTLALQGPPAGVSAVITYTLPAGVNGSVLASWGPYPQQVVFANSGASWHPGQPIPVTVSVTFTAPQVMATTMRNTELGLFSGHITLDNVTGTTASGMTDSFTLQ